MGLYVNVSAYKFINLTNLEGLKGQLLQKSFDLNWYLFILSQMEIFQTIIHPPLN